jgi:hypothetical protein
MGDETGYVLAHYHKNDQQEAMYSAVKVKVKLSLCLIK